MTISIRYYSKIIDNYENKFELHILEHIFLNDFFFFMTGVKLKVPVLYGSRPEVMIDNPISGIPISVISSLVTIRLRSFVKMRFRCVDNEKYLLCCFIFLFRSSGLSQTAIVDWHCLSLFELL